MEQALDINLSKSIEESDVKTKKIMPLGKLRKLRDSKP